MGIKKNRPRSVYFIITIIAALVATIVINVKDLQYEDIDIWVRLICPLLLFAGIFGSSAGSRILRLVGWLGILLFFLCGIQMVIPGENYILGGPDGPPLAAPRFPTYTETGIRFVIFIFITTALTYGFWRLKKTSIASM